MPTDDCEFEAEAGRCRRERHLESVAGHVRFVDVAHYVDLRLLALLSTIQQLSTYICHMHCANTLLAQIGPRDGCNDDSTSILRAFDRHSTGPRLIKGH